eukprot:2097385-Pyramimonas_sp.AAC.1
MATNLWKFGFREDNRAVAGFSVVPKKDPTKQRQIIMMVASNYMFQDVRPREEHGLHGGAALASVRVPSDFLSASAFDESNAFTSVEVPEWMWAWQAVPPIRASLIWAALPWDVRERA